jgi:Lhr-like helicase
MHIHDIPYEELKPIYVSPHSKLNEDIVKNFDDMLSYASPAQYRDMLMEIYNMYILHEHKDLPPDFFEMASRMIVLLDFLKSCE